MVLFRLSWQFVMSKCKEIKALYIIDHHAIDTCGIVEVC